MANQPEFFHGSTVENPPAEWCSFAKRLQTVRGPPGEETAREKATNWMLKSMFLLLVDRYMLVEFTMN